MVPYLAGPGTVVSIGTSLQRHSGCARARHHVPLYGVAGEKLELSRVEGRSGSYGERGEAVLELARVVKEEGRLGQANEANAHRQLLVGRRGSPLNAVHRREADLSATAR